MLITESILTRDPNVYHDKQTDVKIKQTIEYLKGAILTNDFILDVGQRSPMTASLEKAFDCNIDNTDGDLDVCFKSPRSKYNIIIYSHTIEHQFNPLYTLMEIKKRMDSSSTLYIFLPERGKLLWTNLHYHEIDNYRMGLLMERAGLGIIDKVYFKVWHPWYFWLTGIRPMLRLFFEYNVGYKIMINKFNNIN